MTCARREAGAHRPAPSTGSPSRPEPRPGRRRARLFRLLPAIALLFGALGLFDAAPAEAQTGPSVPRNVQVTEGDRKLTLTWQAPASWGTGTGERGYEIKWRPSSSTLDIDWRHVSVSGTVTVDFAADVTSYVFKGRQTARRNQVTVTNGTSYALQIRAFDRGAVASDWVTVSDKTPVAPPPTGLVVTPGTDRLDLRWTAPPGNVTGYQVHYTSAGWVGDNDKPAPTGRRVFNSWVPANYTGGTRASHRITGLTLGTAYRVRVRALFAGGGIGAWAIAPGTPTTAIVMTASSTTVTEGEKVEVTLKVRDPGFIPSDGYGWTVRVTHASGSTARPTIFPDPSRNPAWDYWWLSESHDRYDATDAQEEWQFLDRDGTTRRTEVAAYFRFTPTQLSHTLTLWTRADDVDEGDETIVLEAVEASRHGIAARWLTGTVTITIRDNDCPNCGTGADTIPVAHPYAALIAKIREYRNDPRYRTNKPHTDRWDRVLKAFGMPVADGSLVAMKSSEAQGYADRGWTRWVEVAKALGEFERMLAQPPASEVPVVTIAAGGAVTEGAPAGFTLRASPAPAEDLRVSVTVSQSGVFAAAAALGVRMVTIPAGQTSAAFTVATVDDAADEPDGSVAAALGTGTGYTVGATARATVAVADNDEAVALPAIETGWAIAREGSDEAVVFTVSLSRASAEAVSVDYATADGAGAWSGTAPARAGADYTATSGTLIFPPGQTVQTVPVSIIDDAIDEGTEYFLLRFSNPDGATLASRYRETQGLIRNRDPLQAMWLARFGRTVASDAVAALTARFETPRDTGSHLTVLGQRVNLTQDGSGDGSQAGARALADVLTGFAQTFGAAPAPDPGDPHSSRDPGSGSGAGDPFRRHGLSNAWNGTAPTAAGARRVTGRALLLGTSFRAVLARSAGSQLTSWGQGASVSRFSAGAQALGLSGETATGVMGMDYETGRLLTGFALMHSVGEGAARDGQWRYAMGSTATTVLPYARLALTDRVSVWGMAGAGMGRMTLELDGAVSQRYRTDLSMTLAAAGVRGDLVAPAEAGGFALALKADAFWVRTESDRVSSSGFGNLAAARGVSSRVRAVLDGSRSFALSGGATLTPSVGLGVRHDGGDAETGTGLELGAGLGYADPSRGLDMALRVHGLAAHAERGYREWGVSGQLRLVPGGAGRGLSASLTPSYGADPQGSERLWMAQDAARLAANDNAPPSGRLDAELGYGLALFGGGFTGTPNLGFGLSDTAREYRMGWRLTSALRGDPGFEVSLDATRREAANANEPPEHGVMLRGAIRW